MDDVRTSVGDSSQAGQLPAFQVIRRNGAAVTFNSEKISIALTKAFLAVEGNSANSGRVREQVAALTQVAIHGLMRRLPAGGSVHIEDIQDQVELALMRAGSHDVARAYVLYREKRNAEPCSTKSQPATTTNAQLKH